MLFLLDNDDYQKLILLDFLENSEGTISFQEILDQLNISKYFVKKYINDLHTDLQQFDIPTTFFSIKADKKNIYYKRLSPLSVVALLKYHYGRRAQLRPFVDQLFLERSITQTEFIDQFLMSKPTFSRLRNKLVDYLAKINLKLSPKLTLTGDELFIRGFLYKSYFNYQGDHLEALDQPTKTVIFTLIDQIENIIDIRLSYAERLKMTHFLAVTLNRIQQAHYLLHNLPYHSTKETTPDIAWPTDTVDQVAKVLLARFNALNLDLLRFEAKGILNFLYAELIYTDLDYSNKGAHDLLIDFSKSLQKFFNISKDNLRELYLTERSEQTFIAHFFQVTQYNFPVSNLLKNSHIPYIDENFAAYMDLARDFITIFAKHFPNRLEYFNAYRENLAVDTFFLLLAHMNLTKLARPVNITIDFSNGPAYNKFITTEVENFKALNLRINSELQSDTDIYLSDLWPQQTTNTKNIQWTAPPTSLDWENLGNLIIYIKKNRA